MSAVGPDRSDSGNSGQLLFDTASASQSGLRHLSLPLTLPKVGAGRPTLASLGAVPWEGLGAAAPGRAGQTSRALSTPSPSPSP